MSGDCLGGLRLCPQSVPVFGRLVSQMMKTWLLLFWRDPTNIFQRFCLFVKQEDESDPSIALPSPVGDLPGMHIAHHHWKYYDQMIKFMFRRTSWSVNWSLFRSKASESYLLPQVWDPAGQNWQTNNNEVLTNVLPELIWNSKQFGRRLSKPPSRNVIQNLIVKTISRFGNRPSRTGRSRTHLTGPLTSPVLGLTSMM